MSALLSKQQERGPNSCSVWMHLKRFGINTLTVPKNPIGSFNSCYHIFTVLCSNPQSNGQRLCIHWLRQLTGIVTAVINSRHYSHYSFNNKMNEQNKNKPLNTTVPDWHQYADSLLEIRKKMTFDVRSRVSGSLAGRRIYAKSCALSSAANQFQL